MWVSCTSASNSSKSIKPFPSSSSACINSRIIDRENPNRDEFSGLPKDTLAVVSAIACIMGDREDAVGGPDKMLSGDARATKAALQEIAAAGSAEGEIFGFELLWTPDDDSETLEMDEIMTEWPEIMTC